MSASTITGEDVQAMVSHWLRTPTNGYLGSTYGNDIKALLQLPLSDSRMADALIRKLREDIPVLQILPAGAINLYAVPDGIERVRLELEVSGRTFDVSEYI